MMKIYKVLLSILIAGTIQSAFAQISGDTAVCTGATVKYTTPFIAGASYSWTVTGGSITGAANADSVNILWGSPGSGTLFLTLVQPSNPPVYYFLNVTVHPGPSPVISHPPYPSCPPEPENQAGGTAPDHGGHDACEKVCKYATITYSTPLHPGSTYQWTVTGAQQVSGQNTHIVTVQWDSTALGSLTIVETNAWGCVDSATLCIKKMPLPVAAFTHQANVCLGSADQFTNQSTGAVSYQWYFGDGGSSTLTNPTHIYNTGGTYTITLIAVSNCYCSDTVQSVIHVNSLPGPEISCPSTVCAYDTATYSTSQAGCTYQWFVTGGSILGPSNQQTVTVAWGPGQMGTLGLLVSGCGGVCTDTTKILIPIIPTVAVIAGPVKVCAGDCEEFSLPHFGGSEYTWSLNSGSCGTITDTCECNKVTICWPPSAVFCNDTLKVTYYDAFLGCGGTAFKVIRLRPKLSIFGQEVACANGSSSFSASAGVLSNWTVSPAGPVLSPSPAPFVTVNWLGFTGTFLVTAKPVNPNQVCNDSALLVVNVSAPPPAPVITGDTLVCPGSTQQYCAIGTGTIHWLITGGTPTTGIGNCVSVTWGNTPPFAVNAFVQMPGSPFCSSDTTVQSITPFVSLPQPVITGSGTTCANATNTYFTSIAYPAGVSFQWNITPPNAGTILSGQGSSTIQVEWGNNAPQTATLSLTVSICGLNSTYNLGVTLAVPPNPVIVQSGNLCPGSPAQLNVTGGVFTSYQWSGPGGYNAVTNPATITQNGLYQVTVTNAAGCSALTQITVQYSGLPVASISAQDPLVHCIGTSYSVTLCALGNPGYTYAWSSGGNGQCTTVSAPGSYVVTVTNSNTGCYAVSNVLTVSEDSCNQGGGNCIPMGSVSFTHSSCNPKVFTNASVNAGSFTWNFGDNTGSYLANPVHAYTQAGFYLVTLSGLVPDAAGGDSCMLTHTELIEIPLVAKFNFTSGCFGDPVCFTDQSVFTAGNNITSWNWNFGDAGTSSLQNPCHVYATSGSFIVTLTISNGSCTTSLQDTVIIRPKTTAAFSFSNLNCVNSPVLFTDNSFSNINYWNWNFGNGGTSLNQNPSQSYSLPGSYPVTLIVHDNYGCYDTIVDTVQVVAPSVSGNIQAFPDTVVCAGTQVLLVAPACAGCTYSWSNGSLNDSITVISTGIYAVNVTDQNGCVYSTHIRIIVNPAPSAQITSTKNSLCLGDFATLTVPYNLNWTYLWISTDPNVNNSQGSAVNFFPPAPGTYNFSVVITDTTTGCSDTTLPFIIQVHMPPVPATILSIGPSTVCKGDTITLVASHPDPTVTLTWNTGQISDTIRVTKGGCYFVTAKDTNGCTSQSSFCVTVNPLPDLCSFYEGCFDTCAPYLIYGPAGAATYQWLLNGIPIAGANAQNYLATVSGSYSLAATTAAGCADTTGALNLTLHPCGDTLCATLVIDSVYCNEVAGTIVMTYHVINHSPAAVNEVSLQVLPPHLNTAYAPTWNPVSIAAGDTSGSLSAIFFNAVPDSTYCFRVLMSKVDSSGTECCCCTSDTVCITFPECPPDTACCYFELAGDSLWCNTTPEGITQYHFSFIVEGCGELIVTTPGAGFLSIDNPYTLNNETITIYGSYLPAEGDSVICLNFFQYNATCICSDTTICFNLPNCPPSGNPCDSLQAQFSYVSNGLSTSFTDLSTAAGGLVIAGWSWNFGDPASGASNTSAAQNPLHAFSGPGSYNVCLIVIGVVPGSNIFCAKQVCQKIIVAEPFNPCDSLIAGFSFTASGLNVNFTDASTTPPGMFISGWTWNFGDPASGVSNISNLQNPSHLFTATGLYIVCLKITAKSVSGLTCTDSICIEVYVEGTIPDPCDGVVANYSFVTNGLNAVFTDASTVPAGFMITGWSWNFGDPASGANNLSNLQNPVHYFTLTGWYTVCLTITAVNAVGTDCTDSICKQIYVEGFVHNPCDSLIAAFSFSVNGLTTFFTDASTLPAGFSFTGWSWNFGDPASGANNTSNLQNPVHVFSAAGSYVVCLTITAVNAAGTDCITTLCKQILVDGVVHNPCDSVITAFMFTAAGLNVTFTDASMVPAGYFITSWSWNFGDPASGVNNLSGLQNPVHLFSTTGSYQVCLTITAANAAGSSCTATFCKHIFVEGLPPDPCDAVTAAFNFTTLWLNAGFTDVSTLPPGYIFSGCSWNFGDPASGAANISYLQNPSHAFSGPGMYTVCMTLTVITPAGTDCIKTVCRNVFVISILVSNAGTDVDVFFGDSVVLAGSATGGTPPYSYSWSPPDGLSDPASAAPTASPATTTTYTLMVTDDDGNTATDDVVVTVYPAPPSTLSGTVSYHNSQVTNLSGVEVSLFSGGDLVGTTVTDEWGQYEFTGLEAGVYSLACSYSGPWGGGNSNDALLIMRSFVGLSSLTDLQRSAADVDGTGFINSSDALSVMKRFVGLVPGFPAGDWAFDAPQVTLTPGSSMVQDIWALCMGDVNGDYSVNKTGGRVSLEVSGSMVPLPGPLMTVPVSLRQSAVLGAVSLILRYPEDRYAVKDVEMVNSATNLVFLARSGELRVAWYGDQPALFNAGDTLFNLLLQEKYPGSLAEGDLQLHLDAATEVDDFEGNAIPELGLTYPLIGGTGNSGQSILINSYPNPFTDHTTLSFNLPESGKVSLRIYNSMGREVAVLLDGQEMEAGMHFIDYQPDVLAEGMYLIRISMTGTHAGLSGTRQMIRAK